MTRRRGGHCAASIATRARGGVDIAAPTLSDAVMMMELPSCLGITTGAPNACSYLYHLYHRPHELSHYAALCTKKLIRDGFVQVVNTIWPRLSSKPMTPLCTSLCKRASPYSVYVLVAMEGDPCAAIRRPWVGRYELWSHVEMMFPFPLSRWSWSRRCLSFCHWQDPE